MVTVIQKAPGNALTDVLGALNAVLAGIEANRQAGQQADLLKAALLKGQGEFVPAPAQPRSFLETIFGGSASPNTIHIGDSSYQFQPYPALGEEGARALDLVYPQTRTLAPRAPLPLDDTPAAPLFAQGLPTPATVTEDAPIPGAAEMRLGPKERLEILKERARQRRDQALANAKIERTKLWLTRTPAGVAKYQWLIDALDSDDPTTRELAEAELSRLQAPGRRADTAEVRLDQTYQMHRERLDQRLDELDQRLRAAKDQGDARAEAALTRLRERIAARRDELEFLESGRDYRKELGVEGRRGTGTSDSADMKVDDALAKLKELRAKPYFPGQAAEKLDRVEQLITQAKKQERSHVGPVITKQLKRLELQLNRAERREGVRPQPQTPLKPPPGRQSSTSSATPAAASRQSTPGPSPKMVDAYAEYFRQMTPEEAEVDLKADMADDPALTARGIPSPRTLAKQQAYSRVFPDRPLTLRLPAAATPSPAGATPPPTAPAPAPTPTTPRAEQAAPAPTATDSALDPATLKKYTAEYTKLTTDALEEEMRQVTTADPQLRSPITRARVTAGSQILAQRGQAANPATPDPAGRPWSRKVRRPDTPLRPPNLQEPVAPAPEPPPEEAVARQVVEQYVEQYRTMPTIAIEADLHRTLAADPQRQSAVTKAKLSAFARILALRESPAQTPAPPDDAAP